MKKIFLVLAALVAMTACVQDEMNPDALVPPQEQTPSDTTGTPGTPDTPDTPAVPKAKIVFNELCGNKVEYDTFASPNKFIEIYNAGDAEANLKGWTIRKYASDATDVPEKYNNCWAPVTDIKIPAGGYLVLQADQEDPTVGFNAGLSAEKSLKFELVDADGNVVDKFLRGEDTDPFMEPKLVKNEEASFSRVPNGTGDWAYAVPTPGAANGEKTGDIEGYTPAPDQPEPEPEPEPAKAVVVFNELCGNKVEYDTFASPNKFIEIYNAGNAEANLKGWTIRKYAADATDVPEKYNNCWAPVTDIKIPAGGYLVLQADQTDPTIGFDAGLSAEKSLKFELVDADGNVVDRFLRGEDTDPFMEPKLVKNTEASFSRVPNGTGDWAYAVPTPGTANGEKTGDIEGYTPAN